MTAWIVTAMSALSLALAWVGLRQVEQNLKSTAKAIPKQRDLHDAVEQTRTTHHE